MIDVLNNSLRFAAAGDLLLTARARDNEARGLESLSFEIRDLFTSCDLVLANLECTLSGSDSVPTEPLVLSTERQIRSLEGSGINIVTLGNNHVFDCFDEGFRKITGLLNELDIPWFGAGYNLEEATRPVIVERKGISIAFIGVVDISSGPHHFATEADSGVAPLDIERTCALIKKTKADVDHVVVSPHWGIERTRIPSPEQVKQAKAMVEAGASLIAGHHPHVMQGIEFHNNAPIIYSLGNFQANDVYWRNGDTLTWNRFERTGMILIAEFSLNGVSNVKQIPVFDDGLSISKDKSEDGDRYIQKVNHLLHKGITEKDYKREKLYVQVVKPIIAQLKWSKLKRVRPGHFGKLLKLIYRGSAG